MAAVTGVVLLFLLDIWGAVVFLILFNIVHLYIRIRGLIKSFSKGFDIIRDLSLRGTRKYFQILKYIFSVLLGFAIIFILAKTFYLDNSVKGPILFVVALFTSFFIISKHKISRDLILIIIVFGSIIFGLIV